MKRIIILDFSLAQVHIIWKNVAPEDCESLVQHFCEKNNIKESNMQWMSGWDGQFKFHPLSEIPVIESDETSEE